MNKLFDMTGKVALVTGGAGLLGKKHAEAIIEQGGKVIIADYNFDSAVKIANKLGNLAHAEYINVLDKESIFRVVNKYEKIDVLINNAGHALRAPSVDYPMDDWDRLIELNLTAPFLLSRGLAPPMLHRGAGKVIFTASLWSFLGGRSVPAYTVTKSGIAGMIRALSNEWAPQGVQVNGIAPGYIDTDLTRPAINDPEIGPAFLARIPAGRWGEPQDVAGAALFLASHHSDYITGTIVPVDGGWLAH